MFASVPDGFKTDPGMRLSDAAYFKNQVRT